MLMSTEPEPIYSIKDSVKQLIHLVYCKLMNLISLLFFDSIEFTEWNQVQEGERDRVYVVRIWEFMQGAGRASNINSRCLSFFAFSGPLASPEKV